MQRENALYTDSAGNLANGKGFADAPVLSRDADTLEGLDPLFVAFADPNVHPYRISRSKVRKIITQVLLLSFYKRVHEKTRLQGTGYR